MGYTFEIVDGAIVQQRGFLRDLVTTRINGEEPKDFELLSAFFDLIPTKEVLRFVKDLLRGAGRYEMQRGFDVGPVSEEGFVVRAGYVKLWIFEDETELPVLSFMTLALDFAIKWIEAAEEFDLVSKQLIEEEWIADMKASVSAIAESLK